MSKDTETPPKRIAAIIEAGTHAYHLPPRRSSLPPVRRGRNVWRDELSEEFEPTEIKKPELKVHITDDTPAVYNLLKRTLEKQFKEQLEVSVEISESRVEGERKLIENEYLIAIFDVDMPEPLGSAIQKMESGIRMLERIHTGEVNVKGIAHKFLCTGAGAKEDYPKRVAEAQGYGAEECFNKPFSVEKFLESINNALKESGLPYFEKAGDVKVWYNVESSIAIGQE